mgnify:CR=1 FL=1|jgi:murein DD-endopeptidase MepM/ murein hydrolase activator NlpD|tara:strand:- start:594 stop:1205 length:612 start_codon:yes stop_codon:yes gene_type:complete
MIKFQGSVEGDNYVGYPVEGRITSHFGVRDIAAHSSGHSGVDVAAPEGTEIKAPCDMTIDSVFWEGMDSWKKNFSTIFGNGIIGAIQDKDDDVLGYTIFAHMQLKPTLSEGDEVSAGDTIGIVGSTGISTGPHLHWGVGGGNNRWMQKSKGLLNAFDYCSTITQPPTMPTIVQDKVDSAMAQIDSGQRMLLAVIDEMIGLEES